MIALASSPTATGPDLAQATFEVSPTGVLLFILLGLGLVALLRWTGLVVRRSTLGKVTQARFALLLTIAELTIGAGYVVAALPLLFAGEPTASPFFAVVVVIGALWIGWLILRDLVHGLVFRVGRAFTAGDEVRIGGVRGRVKRMGHRAITLVTASDEEVLVSYGDAARQPVVREPRRLGAARHVFTLTPPPGVGLVAIKDVARLAAFNHHWASVAHDAGVELVRPSVGDDTLEIGVYALDPLHGPEIEAAVRRAVAALAAESEA